MHAERTAPRRSGPLRWLTYGILTGAAAYAAYAGYTWLRYGRTRRNAPRDPQLDRFMPEYEVVEHHSIRVAAPAELTFEAAATCGFQDSPIAHAIFRAREILLRAHPAPRSESRGILDEAQSIGWGLLSRDPHEIVMGAVTQPWEANVVFRPLPPEQFTAFREPDFVKIAWTLRVDPTGPAACIVSTETRVIATDAEARRKFRRYWALLSPGIILIRHAILRQVRQRAEHQFAAARSRSLHS
jgi:hypothetical protein